MPNPRTPSTDDFSTLEIQKRNDNTTTANSTTIPPEYPDRSNGNEFEVEKPNEVYPGQSPERKLTETEQREKKMGDAEEVKKNDEDWDMTKNKSNPETQNRNDRENTEREKSSSGSTNGQNTGNERK